MAWTWNYKPTATVKVQETDSDKMFTIPGCTLGNISPTDAAGHINTLLDIGGKSVSPSEKMTRTRTEEAYDNG